jgi:hypothetical protein
MKELTLPVEELFKDIQGEFSQDERKLVDEFIEICIEAADNQISEESKVELKRFYDNSAASKMLKSTVTYLCNVFGPCSTETEFRLFTAYAALAVENALREAHYKEIIQALIQKQDITLN